MRPTVLLTDHIHPTALTLLDGRLPQHLVNTEASAPILDHLAALGGL